MAPNAKLGGSMNDREGSTPMPKIVNQRLPNKKLSRLPTRMPKSSPKPILQNLNILGINSPTSLV